MKIDLHNHTLYSDGVFSCAQLLQSAKDNQVDVFALTDHDSVLGCSEILDLAPKYGVQVIAGMELSTQYKNESVHIVCLFKNNIVPQEMIEFSHKNRELRKLRAIQMMQLVEKEYGLKIDIDELIAHSDIITRANMMRNIAKCNHMSQKDAGFYVSSKSKAYLPSTHLTVAEGLKLAKSVDALVILAHPCSLPEAYIEEILDYGFDGIEAIYPYNEPEDEQRFRRLAKQYHLFVSAGSDCHGDQTHAPIGTCTLDEKEYVMIKERLGL